MQSNNIINVTSLTRYEMKKGNKKWLLRGLSFSISQGESIGLLGSDEKEKTGLLKSIAKNDKFTNGKINVFRTPLYLQSNYKFDGKLTVEDNIKLICLKYGVKRKNLKMKFSEIMDFLQLEPLIKKNFSALSNKNKMKILLALSLYLDKKLIFIDNLISLKDRDFYKRSLERVNFLKEQNTTFIINSENKSILNDFTNKIIWIYNGELKEFDNSEKTILSFNQNELNRSKLSKDELRKLKRDETEYRNNFNEEEYNFINNIIIKVDEDENVKMPFTIKIIVFSIIICLLLIAIYYVPSRSIFIILYELFS